MKVNEPGTLSFALVTVMVAVRAVIAIAQSSCAQIAAKRIRMIRFPMRAPKRTQV
jgi:hypothetical protein